MSDTIESLRELEAFIFKLGVNRGEELRATARWQGEMKAAMEEVKNLATLGVETPSLPVASSILNVALQALGEDGAEAATEEEEANA